MMIVAPVSAFVAPTSLHLAAPHATRTTGASMRLFSLLSRFRKKTNDEIAENGGICVPFGEESNDGTWPPKRWYLCTERPANGVLGCEVMDDDFSLPGHEGEQVWLCASHAAPEPDMGAFYDEMMA